MDLPLGPLLTSGLQMLDADPSIYETAPFIDDVKDARIKLRGGRVDGLCNISAELLKARGETMIRGLPAILTGVRH